MRKNITLIIIAVLIISISGCSNTTKNNKNIGDNSVISTKTPSNQENNIADKSTDDNIKGLEKSFKEPTDLKKPNIEDARNFKQSLKNGSVIMISKYNNDKLEVYNISMLDKFVDSFNHGKKDYVCIIKGTLGRNDKLSVNKLAEYETDGKLIKSIIYDTYANKNNFVQATPIYFPKIAKTSYGDAIRYSILENKDTPDDMGATIISFNKGDIKN
ncbi:hypothetical protein CSC2_28080 [Clostridium zeae]|uniref:Lipoprotein n=1 Tax=Clostridium zeae TaxID=2759022 RepID=A0ABQ1EBV0_9CLOT|nr:hypothetical protein [Clostridium zeae]GFZ32282.1 hypothetical protein CSC2_28080 [Clostridium zeae]